MRSERYWNRKDASELPPIDLLYRPVGFRIGDRTLMDVGREGKSAMTGLVMKADADGIGILLGFRAIPLDFRDTARGSMVLAESPVGRPSLPVFRLGRRRFVRICARSSEYLLVPSRARIPRNQLKLIGQVGAITSSVEGVSVQLPLAQPDVEIVIQEFMDIVAVATREQDGENGTITKIKTMPYHDWGIGELVERCGSPRLETIGEIRVYGQRLPVRQFIAHPTARLAIAQAVHPACPSFGPAVSTSTLRSMRLLSYDLGKEFTDPPGRGEVSRVYGPRLVLLDQGGAREAVVRTEPRRWRPTTDKTAVVISNDLKFLTLVMNRGATYHMRSEAVDDFYSDAWESREHFTLNDLVFAGDRPILNKGDLATFVLETGQPELVRTMTGGMMSVVTKPQVVSVCVFLTHLSKSEDGHIHVDGYRSTGGLTAFPANELRPAWMIRGGRLRWRPRRMSIQDLQQIAEKGYVPLVFKDEEGTINVAVSLLPQRHLIFPQPDGALAPPEVGGSRKEIKAGSS